MKTFLSRHRFFLRLFLLIFAVGGIAILLVNSAVLGRANDYMELKNRERYLSDAQAFARYVEEQFLMMYTQAARLNYDQDLADLSLNDHVYNQVDFIHRLKSYLNTVPLASEMCIYFEDSDFVISSTAKYDLDYFINGLLSYGDDRLAKELESFIMDSSSARWDCFSTFGRINNYAWPYTNSTAERLLLRVPAVVHGAHATVLYLITTDSLRSLFIKTMCEEEEYAILDEEGNLLYRSDALNDHLPYWQQLAGLFCSGGRLYGVSDAEPARLSGGNSNRPDRQRSVHLLRNHDSHDLAVRGGGDCGGGRERVRQLYSRVYYNAPCHWRKAHGYG